MNFLWVLFGVIEKLEEWDNTSEEESTDEHDEYTADILDLQRIGFCVFFLVLPARTARFPPLIVELLYGAFLLHLEDLQRYIIGIRRPLKIWENWT